MKRSLVPMLVVLGWMAGREAQGADWPQYRGDAARSGATAESLPERLELEWARQLGAPRPAFPGEVRLAYDASYEPVVLGRTMFVPSMIYDGVTALDAETGAERWQFFAEGPVRFAPVAWQDSVYFVSDDSYLYCVDAADGKLRWKFCGVPPGKADRKLLGSGRLISLFPARGGPVLADGVVYFGAGIWSGYGVAIHAVDAKSGRPVWCNADSNRIAKANMDHGIANDAGLTPQGYLAIVHDMLVVPCGEQLPAFLDRKTGALKTYCMGWGGRNGLPKGTWFVAGEGHYLCHGGDLYDLTRANDERFDDPRGRVDFKSFLYPGGFTRIRIDSSNQKDVGPFQQPVFADGVMYDADQGIKAHDLGSVELVERKKSTVPLTRLLDTYPDKWTMRSRELWKMPSKLRVYLKAGPHLFLGGQGIVQSVRIPQSGQTPQIVWQAELEGTPERMLAAGGRLFVVTREGRITAFGPKKGSPVVQRNRPAAAPVADAWTKTAAEILDTAKVREGYAVLLGIGTGRLAEELLRQSNLQVIALDPDAGKVERLRQALHRAGWYGTRASAHVGDPLSYPLPPYFASLVVAESWADIDTPDARKLVAAIYHPLRPYGGTACLPIPAAGRDRVLHEVSRSHLPGAAAAQAGEWLLLSHVGPLPGSAPWSHEEADAACTGASAEQFAKAPLDLLWFDTPPRWFRTPGATRVRIGGGRMFLLAEKLRAVDVFTGRQLWETPLPFSHKTSDSLVAVDDAVYVAGGTTCLAFDPATGRQTAKIDLPDGLSTPWAELRIWQDRLIAHSGKHLLCLDRKTGRLVWKAECRRASLSIAVGSGSVFVSELAKRSAADSAPADVKARAYDLADGRVRWQIPGGGSEIRYSPSLDLVVLSSGIYRAQDGSLQAALPQPTVKPGAKPESIPRPLFLVGTKLLVGTAETYVEYNLQTGKASGKPMAWIRRGCTTPRASAQFVTTRVRGNAACVDLATREIIPFWNVRAACSNNLFPADGVLNMPSLTGGCTCNYLPVSQAYVPAAVIGR